MYQNRESSTDLTVGFLSGAAIGAALALMFAPKSGQAMRQDLSDGVSSLRDAINGYVEQMADRAGVGMDTLKDAVDAATASVEERVSSVIDSASGSMRGRSSTGTRS
ncbi:MAG: YtxH domain-containing protein [Vicinamibacterales bacterium]